jgi:hypothetical protein
MAKYGIVKTISYDLYAEVEAETEHEVYEMLDDNDIEFEQSDGNDEAIEVYLIEDMETTDA